eukprot:scaffold80081_cov15-Tisochrysis_lutea.AAC.1
MEAEETLPTLMKEKEGIGSKGCKSPPPHTGTSRLSSAIPCLDRSPPAYIDRAAEGAKLLALPHFYSQ